jgi:hypothetical protein
MCHIIWKSSTFINDNIKLISIKWDVRTCRNFKIDCDKMNANAGFSPTESL